MAVVSWVGASTDDMPDTTKALLIMNPLRDLETIGESKLASRPCRCFVLF